MDVNSEGLDCGFKASSQLKSALQRRSRIVSNLYNDRLDSAKAVVCKDISPDSIIVRCRELLTCQKHQTKPVVTLIRISPNSVY